MLRPERMRDDREGGEIPVKRILAMVLVLVMALVLTGCSWEDSPAAQALHGKWEARVLPAETVVTWSFRPGGRLFITYTAPDGQSQTEKLRYRVDEDDRLILTGEDGELALENGLPEGSGRGAGGLWYLDGSTLYVEAMELQRKG